MDGATSIFLVFSPDEGKDGAPISAALAIRPQFENGAVKSFAISDNRAWIVATLLARNFQCNGFSVEKPAALATK